MDLLITTKAGKQTKLSSLGLLTTSFEDAPASISRNNETFAGRDGPLDYGGQHDSKPIKVTVYYSASSISDDESIQERVNGLLSQIEPYYVTQIYSDGDMYKFERPGTSTGDLAPTSGTESHKRFLAYRTDVNPPEFQGKVGNKLVSAWTFEFATAELPYGESKPRDVAVASGQSIKYNGSVACSQLEQAFYIVLTAKVASAGGFKLNINDHELDITTPVEIGRASCRERV